MKTVGVFFKISLTGIICTVVLSCGRQDNSKAISQTQIDTPGAKVAPAYKPGLGELMLGIQVHHAKIWFAGKNQNWPLANFETGELQETLTAIKTYCTDRPEIKSLPILYPALTSLNNAVKAKNLIRFNAAFITLTNACNNCHKATHHEFNVIKIPDTPPYANQYYNVK